jgi:MFS family permease
MPVFILYGFHKAAFEPVQRAFVAELAPVEYRASTLGGYQMVVGLCALPASFVAGLLWDKFGLSAPFFLSVVLTAAAAIVIIFVKERKSADA